MKTRSITKIFPAQPVDMGGLTVFQALPTDGMDQLDPFLLIHHASWMYPGSQKPLQAGVGPHPHRGFSPVTFIFKGSVHHRDSRGNSHVVHAGGTQWMHAGMGIIHSERPTSDLAKDGGEQEIIQFWVNVPAGHKMDQPSYQPVTSENAPRIPAGPGTDIQLISGNVGTLQGPIKTVSPLMILRGEVEEGVEFTIPVPVSYNALVYILDGELEVGGSHVSTMQMAPLSNDGDVVTIKALESTRFILLSGEPINETVTHYGPFVMNDTTQVMQAIKDYQTGKMGVLIEE